MALSSLFSSTLLIGAMFCSRSGLEVGRCLFLVGDGESCCSTVGFPNSPQILPALDFLQSWTSVRQQVSPQPLIYLNRQDSSRTSVLSEYSRMSLRLRYSKYAFLFFSFSWSSYILSSFSEINMKSFCLISSLIILTSVLALQKTGPLIWLSIIIWILISLCSFALTMVEILRISFLICLCLDLKRLLSSSRLIIWQVPLLNLARMMHQFLSSSLQLQYCSLLKFLYLAMSLSSSLMLLWVMQPSVKKF